MNTFKALIYRNAKMQYKMGEKLEELIIKAQKGDKKAIEKTDKLLKEVYRKVGLVVD